MGGNGQLSSPSCYPKLAAHPVGKQITDIYKERLGQFTGEGQYAGHNLHSKMYEGRASDDESVKLSVYSPPDLSRPTFAEATSHTFEPTKVGSSFGPSWSTHWFRIKIKVPNELLKKRHLEFHWDAGNEGLVWAEDGLPLQGLTGRGERTAWILPKPFRDGKEHTFYIEMACNRMFGNADEDLIQPPNPNRQYELKTAEIVAVNVDARQLYIDFMVIGDAAREFPGDSWEQHKALQICNAIMDEFLANNGSQDSILKCRGLARQYIGNVDSAKVYDSNNESIVFGIGHCHIDTCWLWPWAETKRKIARSWASQCDLMDRYPEHRFACSQALQFHWLEQFYPLLYDRVKEKVKQGTFQPIGGSWVEHDTNMPSGESLVRQFLYGQRFFEGHFGERCTTFWLPDTFGYSGQLPQLCRLAGMTHFFTQKLSWNNINNFPHTTFNWVALDGSQVICHMCPSETYNANSRFGDVRRSVTRHKSLDQDNTSLLVFGKGDGGGGPTWEQLERLRRCRGLADTTGLLPRVTMGNSVEDFFAQLEQKIAKGTEFATWHGELYFELHRGTYTTQANNKLKNRKSEILLHDIEYLATLATLKDFINKSNTSYKYPKKELDEMWENVLLCQFHDCLPGSSIEMCYDDSNELYAQVFATGKKLLEEALKELGLREEAPADGPFIALNTLPWYRREVIRLPQSSSTSESSYALLASGPGLGEVNQSCEQDAKLGAATITEVKKGVFELANGNLKLRVEKGAITSLIDLKTGREIIAKGQKACQFVLFDDKPLYWQAWDVEVYHLNSRVELASSSTEILEKDSRHVSVVTETKISQSSWIKTTIGLSASIENEASYVEIESEVEWHETMKFLKVEFPVDITNVEASYETQFGVVRRPTHYNTSWDMAKFEVCCHKFADLSESGYGVSILNDSKYGFATCGNVMRLSLLRAPKAPDAHADMGNHRIRYAILPHSGGLSEVTVRKGYEFNNPIRVLGVCKDGVDAVSSLASNLPSIRLSGEGSGLVLDTIKRGEDDDDVSQGELTKRSGTSVILRVFEALGGKKRGSIETNMPVKKVWKCNILEDDLEEVKFEAESEVKFGIELRAFEVATYRLQL